MEPPLSRPLTRRIAKRRGEETRPGISGLIYDGLLCFGRANQLFTSNSKLRQQLEEMNKMNQRLSEDVHQLTVGWNEAQSQLKEKDEVWHKILTVRY